MPFLLSQEERLEIGLVQTSQGCSVQTATLLLSDGKSQPPQMCIKVQQQSLLEFNSVLECFPECQELKILLCLSSSAHYSHVYKGQVMKSILYNL